ncbi:hypothetical protein ADL01_20185 [Streptomyces sp. NRRL WC-3618]|uniref:hypothetical protein n=1 Tax=Streptomyces sp. NRRL WC-3618 TaxID=1519490 RepID=UPI0006AF8FBB|nr:hypothetical protein [Streptomyces sp. NRRL WC-3618]KOV71295.1 hypothetical protein ADL01_20185 [Streptomyces sp. NRRL WC-3618]
MGEGLLNLDDLDEADAERMSGDELMERADGIVAGRGYVGREKATEVAVAVPESRTRILD